MKPSCDLPAADLVAYADGELRAARKEIVEAHLQACPVCRQRMADFRAVDRLIRNSTPLRYDASGRQAIGERLSQRQARGPARMPVLWITSVMLILLMLNMPRFTRDPLVPSRQTPAVITSEPVYMDGRMYFVADDGTHGPELWVTDGTPNGTILIKDINPGPAGSSISELIVVNGLIFFVADDGIHGRDLWKTDGTPDGTTMVREVDLYQKEPERSQYQAMRPADG